MITENKKNFIEIIKFSFIGVLNTVIDFVLLYLLVLAHMDKSIAQVISVTIAMTNSYFLNRYFTFKQTGAVKLDEMIKFVLINLLSMGTSILFMFIFYDLLHVENYVNAILINFNIMALNYANSVLLAKILATPFVLAVNYIGNKFWVFKK